MNFLLLWSVLYLMERGGNVVNSGRYYSDKFWHYLQDFKIFSARMYWKKLLQSTSLWILPKVSWRKNWNWNSESLLCHSNAELIRRTSLVVGSSNFTYCNPASDFRVLGVFFFKDFGHDIICSCTICSRTTWSWTIDNLEKYSKSNMYALGPYCKCKLLQEHIANMFWSSVHSNNAPVAYFT